MVRVMSNVEIQSTKIKKRRPIIDKIVEDRKYLHPKEYEAVLRLPIGMNDVAEYNNEIRLKDRVVNMPDNISLINAIVQKELYAPASGEKPELIIKGKKYDVDSRIYAVIRAITLCSVSKSEVIGSAFTDAIEDWANANGKKCQEVVNLYSYIYYHAYDMLDSAVTVVDVVDDPVEKAVRNMRG